MTPLKISRKIPDLYENAMVIGYPLGGDNVCVTRGVVSRVTTLPYEDPKFFLPSQVSHASPCTPATCVLYIYFAAYAGCCGYAGERLESWNMARIASLLAC